MTTQGAKLPTIHNAFLILAKYKNIEELTTKVGELPFGINSLWGVFLMAVGLSQKFYPPLN
jgi:hypothetical protein